MLTEGHQQRVDGYMLLENMIERVVIDIGRPLCHHWKLKLANRETEPHNEWWMERERTNATIEYAIQLWQSCPKTISGL